MSKAGLGKSSSMGQVEHCRRCVPQKSGGTDVVQSRKAGQTPWQSHPNEAKRDEGSFWHALVFRSSRVEAQPGDNGEPDEQFTQHLGHMPFRVDPISQKLPKQSANADSWKALVPASLRDLVHFRIGQR